MKRNLSLGLLTTMFVVFVLSACQQEVAQPTVQSEPTSQVVANQPTSISPFPTVPNPIPQPAQGKGSVVGMLRGDTPQEPVGLILYLGQLLEVGDGYGGVLDTSIAPSATVEGESGKFYFANVDPGKYSLIIYDVGMGGNAYVDEKGSIHVVEVKEGEILDLGEIILP